MATLNRRLVTVQRQAFVLLVVVVVAVACSSLPSYALLTPVSVHPPAVDLADAIRYQSLERSDFRASSPGADIEEHAAEFAAVLSLYILPDSTSPEDKFIGSESTGVVYALFAVDLKYSAYVDRQNSWWNDAAANEPSATLEHEHIHFALAEILARELSKSLEGFMSRGKTQTEASNKLERAFEAIYQKHVTDYQARNRQFDEDTSGEFDPDRQRQWWEQVKGEFLTFK